MSDDTTKTSHDVTENLDPNKGKKARTDNPPKNGDETRTLSSQFPPAGFSMLDALGKELRSDRAATIRWCLNYTLRHVTDANGNLSIPQADRDFVPHANMIDYCLAGIPTKK